MAEQETSIKSMFMPSRRTSCPSCNGHGNLKFEKQIDDTLLSTQSYSSRKIPELQHYAYFECFTCRALFVDELPTSDDLQLSYNAAEFVSSRDSIYAAATYFAELKKIHLIESGNLLDVGCSDGAFISKVKANSEMSVTGIEPSFNAIENAGRSVRDDIVHTTIEKYKSSIRFDVVTCFQTIEHLSDIDGLMFESLKLIKNGGHMAIVCHDRLAFANRVLGKYSPIFDIEHLQILNKRSIKLLLERHGFVDVRVKSISNKYPVSYWLLLSPLPKMLKEFVVNHRDSWFLNWGLKLRVGNLLAVGTVKNV